MVAWIANRMNHSGCHSLRTALWTILQTMDQSRQDFISMTGQVTNDVLSGVLIGKGRLAQFLF